MREEIKENQRDTYSSMATVEEMGSEATHKAAISIWSKGRRMRRRNGREDLGKEVEKTPEIRRRRFGHGPWSGRAGAGRGRRCGVIWISRSDNQ